MVFFGMKPLTPYFSLLEGFPLSISAILCGNIVGLCLCLRVIDEIVALEFLSFFGVG